jgi:hypothetical protein
MSPCSICGRQIAAHLGFCQHHSASGTDSWAASNRIMCDFVHRGVAPPRLQPAERLAELSRALADTM